MASSWKCAECGLVNFASAAKCKRCGAAAVIAGVPGPSPPAGTTLQDGYVLPPPPSGGVWRDQSTLVMTKDAVLPDRCVKCNAPADGFRLKRKLAWHHPAIYLLALMAVLIYALVAGILSKRAIIYVGLCAEHVRQRLRKIVVGWLLFVASFAGIIVAIAYNSGILGLLGVGAFFFAVAWLIVVTRVVTPKRIDDQLIWLKGVNSDLLSQLPPWQRKA